VEGEDPQEVIGAAVRARQQANALIVGEHVVDEAVASLPSRLRREVEDLSTVGWISLSKVETLQDAIARVAGRDPEELHDLAVRRAQEIALKGIYRLTLRLSTDRWLVSRAQMMFRKTRRIGQLAATIPEPGRARAVLTEWPSMSDRGMRQVGLGIESLLSLTGRRNVRTTWEREGDGAVYDARWSPPRAIE
jgi:hypothetical protein